MPRNRIAQELEAIAHPLDANRDILDLIYRDLAKYRRTDTGRNKEDTPRRPLPGVRFAPGRGRSGKMPG
jgi:hypothetical protein